MFVRRLGKERQSEKDNLTRNRKGVFLAAKSVSVCEKERKWAELRIMQSQNTRETDFYYRSFCLHSAVNREK